MRLSVLPGCCGIGVIHGLDFPTRGFDAGEKLEELDAWKTFKSEPEMEAALLDQLNRCVKLAKFRCMGLVTATTNHFQVKAAARLEAVGFKPLRKFNNPVHGNDVIFWEKSLNPKKFGNPKRAPKMNELAFAGQIALPADLIGLED